MITYLLITRVKNPTKHIIGSLDNKKTMRIITLITLLLCYSSAQSQISVVGGFNHRIEDLSKLNEIFWLSCRTSKTNHNYLFLGLNLRYNQNSSQFEFSHLMKKDVPTFTRVTEDYGGGSSPHYSTIYDYSAYSDFNYLGFKFTQSKYFEGKSILFKKRNSAISLGGFVHLDFLYFNTEYNHQTHVRAKNNSNSQQVFVETANYYSHEPFQALKISSIHASLGLNFSRRIYIKNSFIEYKLALGLLVNQRTKDLQVDDEYEYDPKKLYFEYGLSYGFMFPKKSKEAVNEKMD